jgi:SAM-dependent methyltransferase
MGRARLGHYLLGIGGVALIRRWLVADPAAARRQVERIADIVGGIDEGLAGVEIDVPELGVAEGYGSWAATYDDVPNPLIRVEEPAVRSILEDVPPGRALDAACGTGRHAAYLGSRGHAVVGVDATPEMLEKARARHPEIDFRTGSLTALPVETDSRDVVVCALALAHAPDLRAPFAELARVTRPGGRIVISDFHPVNVILGGEAMFRTPEGGFALVRSFSHQIGEYVNAAVDAGLEVRRCLEPRWSEAEVAIMAGPLLSAAPEAFCEALVGLPGALVLDLEKRRSSRGGES